MSLLDHESISRRAFLKTSASGLLGLSLSQLLPGNVAAGSPEKLGFESVLDKIEPQPVLKVLRWSEFVSSEKEVWLENTRRWEKLTGGRVVTEFVPWTTVRHNAAMNATIGTGHDIVIGFHDDPHLYPDKLVDVTDIAEYLSRKYGGWYPVAEAYGRLDGSSRWIALPVGLSGWCMNYRKSRLKEVGFERLPKDIYGFLRCCKALKAKGYYTGFALGHAVGDGNGWCHWWLWSFGGKTVERDGETLAINSKETIRALESARELYETMMPGVENWLDPHNNKAFLHGDISLTNNGSSIVYAAKQNFPELYNDIATKNAPIGPVGKPMELSTISTGYIFKHTQVPNAAKHFLAFMLEQKQYGAWIANSYGYITQSLKDYYKLPSWQKDARITPYRECTARMIPNGYAGPLGTRSAAVMSEYIVVDMFREACTGNRSAKGAVLQAEKRLKRLYR